MLVEHGMGGFTSFMHSIDMVETELIVNVKKGKAIFFNDERHRCPSCRWGR